MRSVTDFKTHTSEATYELISGGCEQSSTTSCRQTTRNLVGFHRSNEHNENKTNVKNNTEA